MDNPMVHFIGEWAATGKEDRTYEQHGEDIHNPAIGEITEREENEAEWGSNKFLSFSSDIENSASANNMKNWEDDRITTTEYLIDGNHAKIEEDSEEDSRTSALEEESIENEEWSDSIGRGEELKSSQSVEEYIKFPEKTDRIEIKLRSDRDYRVSYLEKDEISLATNSVICDEDYNEEMHNSRIVKSGGCRKRLAFLVAIAAIVAISLGVIVGTVLDTSDDAKKDPSIVAGTISENAVGMRLPDIDLSLSDGASRYLRVSSSATVFGDRRYTLSTEENLLTIFSTHVENEICSAIEKNPCTVQVEYSVTTKSVSNFIFYDGSASLPPPEDLSDDFTEEMLEDIVYSAFSTSRGNAKEEFIELLKQSDDPLLQAIKDIDVVDPRRSGNSNTGSSYDGEDYTVDIKLEAQSVAVGTTEKGLSNSSEDPIYVDSNSNSSEELEDANVFFTEVEAQTVGQSVVNTDKYSNSSEEPEDDSESIAGLQAPSVGESVGDTNNFAKKKHSNSSE